MNEKIEKSLMELKELLRQKKQLAKAFSAEEKREEQARETQQLIARHLAEVEQKIKQANWKIENLLQKELLEEE